MGRPDNDRVGNLRAAEAMHQPQRPRNLRKSSLDPPTAHLPPALVLSPLAGSRFFSTPWRLWWRRGSSWWQ
jgi:hypothetical protein